MHGALVQILRGVFGPSGDLKSTSVVAWRPRPSIDDETRRTTHRRTASSSTAAAACLRLEGSTPSLVAFIVANDTPSKGKLQHPQTHLRSHVVTNSSPALVVIVFGLSSTLTNDTPERQIQISLLASNPLRIEFNPRTYADSYATYPSVNYDRTEYTKST